MKSIIFILIVLFFHLSSGQCFAQSAIESSTLNPMVVKAKAFVFDNGRKTAELSPGDKVFGLFTVPFYRVKLENGKEGWIEAALLESSNRDMMALGHEAYRKKNYKKAVDYFNKAVELDSKDFSAYFWLSAAYLSVGDNDQAVLNIVKVLKLDPHNKQGKKYAKYLASLYFENGQKYLKNHHYMNAILAFKRVLELKPSSKVAKEKYAYARKMLGYDDSVSASTETNLSSKIVKRYVAKVEKSRTYNGTSIKSALRSLLSLLKSSGTEIYVDGWQVKYEPTRYLVSYVCRREVEGETQVERFDWKVGRHIHSVTPVSNNARLLMRRW